MTAHLSLSSGGREKSKINMGWRENDERNKGGFWGLFF